MTCPVSNYLSNCILQLLNLTYCEMHLCMLCAGRSAPLQTMTINQSKIYYNGRVKRRTIGLFLKGNSLTRPVGCWYLPQESLFKRRKCTLVTTQSTQWSKTRIYHMKSRSLGISHWVKSLPSNVTMTRWAQAGQLFGTTLRMTLSGSAISSMRPQHNKALKNFTASL